MFPFLSPILSIYRGGFFKTVDRVKCDRELLEKAQGFADEGNISEEQAGGMGDADSRWYLLNVT